MNADLVALRASSLYLLISYELSMIYSHSERPTISGTLESDRWEGLDAEQAVNNEYHSARTTESSQHLLHDDRRGRHAQEFGTRKFRLWSSPLKEHPRDCRWQDRNSRFIGSYYQSLESSRSKNKTNIPLGSSWRWSTYADWQQSCLQDRLALRVTRQPFTSHIRRKI